jgi:hypothetical protein
MTFMGTDFYLPIRRPEVQDKANRKNYQEAKGF